MAASNRPRRSVLYMPGSNDRAMDKARALPADGIIFDLEDAVAPDRKVAARGQVMQAVETGGYGPRELVVRVNGLETEWGQADLAAAAKSGADAVLLPKVDSPALVQQAEAILAAAGAPSDLAIWCMMETALGFLHVREIAGCSPRLGCLVMGTSDLAAELRAQHTPQRLPMLTALGLCLLAARAYGLAALDGVYLDLDDEIGFEATCHQGRELGFDGKTLIHPKQLAASNQAFGPSGTEIVQARRILAAHAEATAAGKGVVLVDGKLIETLHVEAAKRLLTLADAVAQRDAG
jgi:citrate lyase subunit beta/citryl-CoA lyase